jgi:hypothetical protein
MADLEGEETNGERGDFVGVVLHGLLNCHEERRAARRDFGIAFRRIAADDESGVAADVFAAK